MEQVCYTERMIEAGVIELGKIANLQDAIAHAYRKGIRDIELRGSYTNEHATDNLLRLDNSFSGLALHGEQASLDGNHHTSHVILVEDADITLRGLTIRGGDTTNPARVSKHYSGRTFRSIYEAIDGAGLLVVGHSNVKLVDCDLENNASGMCGGGISNQGTGLVRVENCRFVRNSAYHTGAAIDNLTPGAHIKVTNTRFEDNRSNSGSLLGGPHGQITIFGKTEADISDCDFAGKDFPMDVSNHAAFSESNNTWNGEATRARQSGGLKDPRIFLKHTLRQASFAVRHSRYGLYPKVRS